MMVLNAYAGLGGNRKHWHGVNVVAVEQDPTIAEVYQELYPDDEIVVGDAHDYILNNFKDFNFIWSSPPCQRNSKMDLANYRNAPRYADLRLYEEQILLNTYFDGLFVIENVKPYYKPLIRSKDIGRHAFWANFHFEAFDVPRLADFINLNTNGEKQKLMDWLGIQYDKNIYYAGNHCPLQVLRNCVHPKLGLQIFEQAMAKIEGRPVAIMSDPMQQSLI